MIDNATPFPARVNRIRPFFQNTNFILAVATWSLLVILVLFCRIWLLPIYHDFNIALPTATLLLIHPLAAVGLTAIVGLLVVLNLAIASMIAKRRIFLWITALGIVSGIIFAYSFFNPLMTLTNSLT